MAASGCWGEELIAKRYKRTFGGTGNVLYLDSGGSYTIVYICPNSQNCIVKGGGFYCKCILPQLI